MNDLVFDTAKIFGSVSSVLLLIAAVGLYLLPTIIGRLRKKRNLPNIAFFNIFLGWTLIAWVVMLIEALKRDEAP